MDQFHGYYDDMLYEMNARYDYEREAYGATARDADAAALEDDKAQDAANAAYEAALARGATAAEAAAEAEAAFFA